MRASPLIPSGASGSGLVVHDYRKLRVYEYALDITERTYRLTSSLPASERYGLRSQMNRSAVSIAANIAEGAGRGRGADFRRFLRIARGSAAELEALARVCCRVDLIDSSELDDLTDRIERIKASLTNLERSPHA